MRFNKLLIVLLLTVFSLLSACSQPQQKDGISKPSTTIVSNEIANTDKANDMENKDDGFQNEEAEYFPTDNPRYKKIGNARFNFWIDIPVDWKAFDRSANGDGYIIVSDNENIDIRTYGGFNVIDTKEYLDVLKGDNGKMSDVVFNSNIVGKQIINPNSEIKYSCILKDRYINFYVNYSKDKNWFKKNEDILLYIAKSLRSGEDDTSDTTVITDIANWNHPTKEAFKDWNYSLTRVELINNKTYPVFYVKKNSTTEDVIYKYNFLKEIAEKNGYWNFKIVDDTGEFITVECNKNQKVLTKSVSDKETIDYLKYDYSDFQGKWYSTDNINFGTKPYIMELTFDKDGKNAKVHIIGYKQNGKKADEYYTTMFNYSGSGKLNEFSDKDNEIILSKEEREIEFYVDRTVVPMGTEFLKANDINNIAKCMDIVAKKEGIEDWRKRNGTDVKEDEAVYIRYEGKDDTDFTYQIAVRWSKDTVIKYWYYFDPITFKYEVNR